MYVVVIVIERATVYEHTHTHTHTHTHIYIYMYIYIYIYTQMVGAIGKLSSTLRKNENNTDISLYQIYLPKLNENI